VILAMVEDGYPMRLFRAHIHIKKESSMSKNKEELIKALNTDLATEFQAVEMYTVYSAKVTGPWRQQLADFMQAEIPDELRHAQFLADKVAALRGEPTTEAAAVPSASTAEEMLTEIVKAEEEAVQRYTMRAREAEEYGDKALAVNLENMVADEQGHMEQTQKFLDGWK
jgi:bacterioferritin